MISSRWDISVAMFVFIGFAVLVATLVQGLWFSLHVVFVNETLAFCMTTYSNVPWTVGCRLIRPPILWHRRPIPIALSVCLSVCLTRCVLWPTGARYAYSVHRSRIGMWGGHFDWHHCRPPRFTLTPKTRSRIRGYNETLRSKGGRYCKIFVLRGIV